MDVGALGQWLWDAACEVRGPLDAPKFKDYILPFVFLRRLVASHTNPTVGSAYGSNASWTVSLE